MDLVDEFFHLKIELFTSLEVINELEDGQQTTLLKRDQLTILKVTEVDFLEERGNKLSAGLSIADTSVFHHAKELQSGILTGDNLLKKISETLEFEVHGIIWVLDELVSTSIINGKSASEKLEFLMEYNKRLPSKECQKIIKKWSS